MWNGQKYHVNYLHFEEGYRRGQEKRTYIASMAGSLLAGLVVWAVRRIGSR